MEQWIDFVTIAVFPQQVAWLMPVWGMKAHDKKVCSSCWSRTVSKSPALHPCLTVVRASEGALLVVLHCGEYACSISTALCCESMSEQGGWEGDATC